MAMRHHMQRSLFVGFILVLLLLLDRAHAFSTRAAFTSSQHVPHNNPRASGCSRALCSTQLQAVRSAAASKAMRETLLARRGPYFKLDRFSGKIEFGATADLVTELSSTPAPDKIAAWLLEEEGRGLATSIWDESLMTKKANDVYRLQVMSLQFVTIRLAPWVDVQMKTIANKNGKPTFYLQSMDFDPCLQVLPGLSVTAESLGIVIDVAGELTVSQSGKGVAGVVTFQTAGVLPPPMRLLPQAALEAACGTINQTIIRFAVESFQRGARQKFREFQK